MPTRNLVSRALVALAMLYAIPAHAQISSTEAVADPPQLPTDAQLEAWAARYVRVGDYVRAGLDADRNYLYQPSSFRKLANGHLLGSIRAELFRPRVEEGYTVRSVRKLVQVDCDALRYRELTVEGFAGSNLRHPVAGLPVSETWTKPLKRGSVAALRLLEPVCIRFKDLSSG